MKYNPPQARHRSRRLRKKLRIGEFRELGFSVKVEFKRELSREESLSLTFDFLAQVIDPRGLAYGGFWDDSYLSTMRPGSVTEVDREAITTWLLSRSEVSAVVTGEYTDSWHCGPQYVYRPPTEHREPSV
ncbi:50S ribosome-binding protein YggL [Roseateles sp.]|uniref:50S ribosome-binding protein YggL n=1 Tax=Roseateles sp. TaxID=1971397 RepID=UPI003D104097